MYDFIKLDITHVGWDNIYNNHSLEWRPLFDPITGEMFECFRGDYRGRRKGFLPNFRATYKNMILEAYNVFEDSAHHLKIILSGSLHYLRNNGVHNANNYTLQDHFNVVNELVQKVGIDPQKAKIESLEVFCLIFNCLYNVDKIIDNIFFHSCRGSSPKRYNYEEFKGQSSFKIAKRKQYYLKIYNKGKHFGINDIFKFELKAIKSKVLQKTGAIALSDLVIPEKIKSLNDLLFMYWKDTFLYDWTIDKSELSRRQNIQLRDYRNPIYWMSLPKRNERNRTQSKYNNIVSEYSDGIHKYIAQMISQNGCNFQESR